MSPEIVTLEVCERKFVADAVIVTVPGGLPAKLTVKLYVPLTADVVEVFALQPEVIVQLIVAPAIGLFVAELVISFLMMTMILNVSNSARIARFTGVIAGALVATYITLEAPLSGMSMSPARTFASAASGRIWNALWLYFTAPPLGMLLAAQAYLWLRGKHAVFCAKLHHDNDKRCIFRCNYKALSQPITLKETI